MPDTSHEPTNTVESPPAAANVTPPPAAANETPPNVAPASRRQQAAAPSLGQSALRYSVLGLGLGIAVGFVPLAQYTCALVLWSDSPNLMRPATPDGQPVPALLSWGATLFRALTAVGGMPLAGALGVYIALVGCAAYAIVRAVNPTFRVTTGVDWDRMLLFRTYMHTAPLIKVVVTAVPAFVVAFGLWMGARLVVPWGEAQAWLAAVVFGATAWVTLSRTGLIGDCDSGNYELPSARRALGMALRGAAFAVVTQIVFLSAAVVAPEALLRMAGAMGGVGEAAWRPVATIWLAASGLGGSVIGVASVVLGRPSTHMVARLRGLVVLAACVATYPAIFARWAPAYAWARYDYDLRKAEPVKPAWWTDKGAWAERAIYIGVPLPASNGEGTGWRVRRVRPVGVSGVLLSSGNVRKVEALLSARAYRSAMSEEASTALYDWACLNLSAGTRLDLAAGLVQRTGNPQFARILLDDLAMLAGDAEAAKRLAVLGNRRVFEYPTDDSRLPIGDLYASHGDVALARRWYALGGIPDQRAVERAARLVAVARSQVSGRIAADAPGWEVRVALAPAFGALATGLRNAGTSAVLGPFELRDVVRSTKPGARGDFAMRDVMGGTYRLVLWMRGPAGRELHNVSVRSAETAPDLIECDGVSGADVGTVTVRARSFTR